MPLMVESCIIGGKANKKNGYAKANTKIRYAKANKKNGRL